MAFKIQPMMALPPLIFAVLQTWIEFLRTFTLKNNIVGVIGEWLFNSPAILTVEVGDGQGAAFQGQFPCPGCGCTQFLVLDPHQFRPPVAHFLVHLDSLSLEKPSDVAVFTISFPWGPATSLNLNPGV